MKILTPKTYLATVLLAMSTQGTANDLYIKKVAVESFNSTTLAFDYKGNYHNATISVAGPNGYHLSVLQKEGTPMLDLWEEGNLEDGLYKYQISVATDKKVIVRDNKLDNGRGNKERKTVNIGETQSGNFLVKDGSIVDKAKIKEVEAEGGNKK